LSYAGVYLERYSQSLHAMEARTATAGTVPRSAGLLPWSQAAPSASACRGKWKTYSRFSRQDKRALLTIGSGADEPLELVRVKPVQTDRVRLEDYAGTYFSQKSMCTGPS
jgi:hypothetical protein